MIVDSHCHVSPVWFEPVETLFFQMDRVGVEKAALVQLLGQIDNTYQQDCVASRPDRLISVVGVDPADPEALAALRRAADVGAAGLRLRPDARSPGEDPLAIWREAARLKLPISCVGPAAAFAAEAFADLIALFPETPIILEHLGGVARPDFDHKEATTDAVFALARLPNVYLKAPGLGQLAPRTQRFSAGEPSLDQSRAAPVLAALRAFGAERLMWGSDFPPVSTREGYGNALSWMRDIIAAEAPTAVAEVFGGAAARVFNLS